MQNISSQQNSIILLECHDRLTYTEQQFENIPPKYSNHKQKGKKGQ